MQQDMQERQRRADRIEALIQEVATFSDSQARATTEELIQALLDMYGEGLAKILELTEQTEASGHATHRGAAPFYARPEANTRTT